MSGNTGRGKKRAWYRQELVPMRREIKVNMCYMLKCNSPESCNMCLLHVSPPPLRPFTPLTPSLPHSHLITLTLTPPLLFSPHLPQAWTGPRTMAPPTMAAWTTSRWKDRDSANPAWTASPLPSSSSNNNNNNSPPLLPPGRPTSRMSRSPTPLLSLPS
jgi:hypothetical protein